MIFSLIVSCHFNSYDYRLCSQYIRNVQWYRCISSVHLASCTALSFGSNHKISIMHDGSTWRTPCTTPCFVSTLKMYKICFRLWSDSNQHTPACSVQRAVNWAIGDRHQIDIHISMCRSPDRSLNTFTV